MNSKRAVIQPIYWLFVNLVFNFIHWKKIIERKSKRITNRSLNLFNCIPNDLKNYFVFKNTFKRSVTSEKMLNSRVIQRESLFKEVIEIELNSRETRYSIDLKPKINTKENVLNSTINRLIEKLFYFWSIIVVIKSESQLRRSLF